MPWSEIRGGSGALLGKLDRGRMLIELWDRRAGATFVYDLSEAALAYAAEIVARQCAGPERLAATGAPTVDDKGSEPQGRAV